MMCPTLFLRLLKKAAFWVECAFREDEMKDESKKKRVLGGILQQRPWEEEEEGVYSIWKSERELEDSGRMIRARGGVLGC